MTFDEKRAAAVELLASKGLWRASYAPTLVAWLWRLGAKIPPPHFAGFFGTLLFSGSVFGVAWGLLMWVITWSRHGVSPLAAVGISAAVGLLFGLGMASYYRYSARKHSIPTWNAFVPPEARRDRS